VWVVAAVGEGGDVATVTVCSVRFFSLQKFVVFTLFFITKVCSVHFFRPEKLVVSVF